ncbi:MAG: DUF2268 domain-containing putative Zn-dependent protease, partial [Planctomycetota bacterium]
IHETWHAFQGRIGSTLNERSMHEGVATYLTQVVDESLPDHKVMMWSSDQWQAATKHRDAIVKAFVAAKDSRNARDISGFTQLGGQVTGLREAPDRSGYYVGFLACRACQAAHPQRTPADLIATDPEDLLQSLIGSQ